MFNNGLLKLLIVKILPRATTRVVVVAGSTSGRQRVISPCLLAHLFHDVVSPEQRRQWRTFVSQSAPAFDIMSMQTILQEPSLPRVCLWGLKAHILTISGIMCAHNIGWNKANISGIMCAHNIGWNKANIVVTMWIQRLLPQVGSDKLCYRLCDG